MPSKSTNATNKQFSHDDHLHSFTLVFDDGLEIAVTPEMVDKACENDHLEIFPFQASSKSL